MNRSPGKLLAVIALLGTWPAFSQQTVAPTSTYVPPSSNPEELTVCGEYVYFTADDGIHGRELWRATLIPEPGSVELVADLTPGRESSRINGLYPVDDYLLFRMEDSEGSGQLWRSDLDSKKTVLLASFEDSGEKGFKYPLATIDGKTYLSAPDVRLSVTDGTVSGTREVLDGLPLRNDLMVHEQAAAEVNGALMFSGTTEGWTRNGLWRSDGTAPGTNEIAQFSDRPVGITRIATNMRNGVVFGGTTLETGLEPWFSDGTPAGTRLIADIRPRGGSSSPSHFLVFQHWLFFDADDGVHGRELWHCDLRTMEVARLTDIVSGPGSSSPYKLATIEYGVVFLGKTPEHGVEPWRIGLDEQEKLTRPKLSDIRAGINSSMPYAFSSAGEYLYFSAEAEDHGEELYALTINAGAALVRDIYPGPLSAEPYGTVSIGGIGVFAATAPLHGRELWRTNGTEEATYMIADINTDTLSNPSSRPQHLAAAGPQLFFVASDIVNGTELWVSDGTEQGTRMVRDIFPGRAGSYPEELTAVGDIVYFRAEDGIHGSGLWKSDGTNGGTIHLLGDQQYAPSAPRELMAFGDVLILVAQNEKIGEELYRVKGQDYALVRDIRPGAESSSPRDLTVWNGAVYFRADDGIHGEELWRTDGTKAGTELVRDLLPLPIEGASVQYLTPSDKGLYFAADDGQHGQEVWILRDGQPWPTLVRDFRTTN